MKLPKKAIMIHVFLPVNYAKISYIAFKSLSRKPPQTGTGRVVPEPKSTWLPVKERAEAPIALSSPSLAFQVISKEIDPTSHAFKFDSHRSKAQFL